MDGLIILISDHLQMNPTSGQLFLFRNRHANKIKMLWWDRHGFCLLYKRWEKGRLKFPAQQDRVMELSHDQLGWLLSGLDMTQQTSLPITRATNFY